MRVVCVLGAGGLLFAAAVHDDRVPVRKQGSASNGPRLSRVGVQRCDLHPSITHFSHLPCRAPRICGGRSLAVGVWSLSKWDPVWCQGGGGQTNSGLPAV